MSENDKLIIQLKSEAEANFSASRWEDSAKTYEHLVGLAQNNNDFENAIDFALAAIHAWKRMPDKKVRINRLYQAVGIIGLKKAALDFEAIAQQAQAANNHKEAALYFEESGDAYYYIQSFDKAKKCYQLAVDMFDELSSKAFSSDDFEGAIHLFDKTSCLYVKMQTLLDRIVLEKKNLEESLKKVLIAENKDIEKSLHDTIRNKALAHEKLADFYLSKKDSDLYPIVEKELDNAICLLEAIGDDQKVKKLHDKKPK
ncbi:MAG: hypothetical protein FK734_02640 [Asgard group archaeon]|nr:hypothetical protein [Asgard group archaeon]